MLSLHQLMYTGLGSAHDLNNPFDAVAAVAVGTVVVELLSVVVLTIAVQVVACMEQTLRQLQNWQNAVEKSGMGMRWLKSDSDAWLQGNVTAVFVDVALIVSPASVSVVEAGHVVVVPKSN